jgi:hypothetical protein
MKFIVKAHFVTAVAGWLLVMIVSGSLILDEGGLVGLASLCLMGVATIITIIDVLSVYLVRKGKATFLPILSAAFWGVVLLIYSIGVFAPEQPWQSRVTFLALDLVAIFKVGSIISLLKSEKAG